MINNRKDITFFRGDTYRASIELVGYEPSARDVLKYALKRSTRVDEEPIVEHTIECPSDVYELRFDHLDTDELDEGTYYYDLQLIVEGSEYKTILYGCVLLKGDVTD